MLKKPQLILIDLDGTLVDSVPDLAWSVDRLMEKLGRPVHGEDKVRHWVGNGVERLTKRALTEQLHAEPDAAEYDKALPIFMDYYHQSNGKYSRVFDGVVGALKTFTAAGFKVGCVTNKAEAFTLPLLESLGIRKYFEVVVSGDTTAHKKPHPEPLLYAAKQFGVAPENCLMIGDSQHDVQAARNAGFQVAAVTYGYNHGEDIRDAKPDAVVDRMDDIPGLWA
ncbi:MAG: phosphoglycolate phosphatase [Gammaproteobacteria bacterium]|nr:phosphoglycolate phosphatase [Gammaproteobacteria bacterium]